MRSSQPAAILHGHESMLPPGLEDALSGRSPDPFRAVVLVEPTVAGASPG